MNILFIILYTIVFLLSFGLEKKVYKCHITPLSFFSCLWCIVGIVANLGLYEYYLPSFLVNMIILISAILVMITFVIFTNKRTNSIKKLRNIVVNVNYSLAVLLIMEIVWFFLIFPKFIDSLSIIQDYDMTILRASETLNISNVSGITSNLIEIFVKPGYMVISIMATISMFHNISPIKKRALWIANIFNIIIFTITTAGRLMIVNSLFYFAFSIMIFRGNKIKHFIIKEKKKIIPLVLLIIALLYMQDQRSGDASILETFYTYYFSGPSFLTQLLEANKNVFTINHDFMFGSATFGFITNVVSYILIFLSGTPQGSIYTIGSVLTNHNLAIGNNTQINAMCTCFYNFMLDWGYLGIFIGSVFISGLASYFYFNTVKKKCSYVDVCILIFFINVLIRTIFKWELLPTDILVVMAYLKFFSYTQKIRVRM